MLPLTGERTGPGIWHENYWFRRHEAAYLAALSLTRGRRVLEAGCGEGYGAALLRDDGADVVAVDLDARTLAHARREYGLVCVQANLVSLPFADATFDTVVSLQTIEHLWDQPGFVAECARVLTAHGLLLLTTPNRLTFSPDSVPGTPPTNPFHSRELDARELAELLGDRFDVVQLAAVSHGPRIAEHELGHGDIVSAQLTTPADQWDETLASLVTGVDATDFTVTTSDVEAGLDLFVVAERRP